jgi:sigma-E factor negative regulatory protein RseA
MTDPVKEQLSACLDGELPEGELDLLLKRLERDPHLRRSIGNYALVAEALRSQRPVAASAGFAARVSAAIAAEPAGKREPAPRISPAAIRWLRPAAGVAIAAGVAAVAVVSLRPTAMQPQLVAINEPAPTVVNEPAQAPSYTVPTNPGSTAFVPAARLTNYVVAHSEYSSPLGRRTVLSGVLSDDETGQGDLAVPEVSRDDAPATSDPFEPQR